MKLTINGKEEVIDQENINIPALLKVQNVEMPEMVSVELNGEFLERENFEETIVKDGDKVEFLFFMGGGEK